MKRLGLLATVVALFAIYGMASADSLSINFEQPAFTPGVIHGQQGWSSLGSAGSGCAPYDHRVNINSGAPASFGAQSLRISNAYTSGCFGDQTFSRSLVNEAGEATAANGGMSSGVRVGHFETSWSIVSTDPTGPETDSYFSASPDRGDGARMSYLRFEDHPTGIAIIFNDYRDNAPYGAAGSPASAALGCGAEDDFTETLVATVSRGTPHTVKISMDLTNGARNDVVNVYVDGALVITGTSWEDYFRWCTESGGGTGTAADQSRTVDSVLFRSGGGDGFTHPANLGKGFLIDNLTLGSARVPNDKDDCKGDGWRSLTRADGSPFKNQGDCVSYSNNGRGPSGNGTTHGNGHNKPN